MAYPGDRKSSREIDFKYNLSLYSSFLNKHRPLFFLILVIILIIESFYLITQYLFKIVIDRGTEFAAGSLARDAFITILLVVLVIYLVKIVITSILKFFHIHSINRLDSKLIADLKRRFFNHIIHLDHNFHTTHKTGSLISRLIRSGGAIERMTDVIVFNFVPMIVKILIISASLIYFTWIPALIIFLVSLTFIIYSFVIQRAQEKANIAALDAEDREKANISDIFTNIDSVKYFGKENTIKSRYKKLSEISKKARIFHWDYFRWLDSVQGFILSVGTLLLVYFTISQFLSGQISIGTVVFAYTTYTMLIGSLFGFVHGIRNFYRSMADFEVLFQYAKVENAIKDQPGAKKLKIREGAIDFKEVDFSYGKRKIFRKFNLKIPKNMKVALVGHSGCGKTTLIKLLYRFYDVKSGEILIDGKNIKDFKQESLREEMSIVPQECVLFDDTVYNNIAFSNPKATREQVMRAIKFAQLDKIIKNFPHKEKTIVGERGVKLSGGEKQRVSIARAILANKKILVLDEATSSLDSETEHEIQKDLEKLMQGRTSIIIAHRLSTIMNADIIVVMRKGRIMQIGNHRDLITEGGEYQRLWDFQKGGYIR